MVPRQARRHVPHDGARARESGGARDVDRGHGRGHERQRIAGRRVVVGGGDVAAGPRGDDDGGDADGDHERARPRREVRLPVVARASGGGGAAGCAMVDEPAGVDAGADAQGLRTRPGRDDAARELRRARRRVGRRRAPLRRLPRGDGHDRRRDRGGDQHRDDAIPPGCRRRPRAPRQAAVDPDRRRHRQPSVAHDPFVDHDPDRRTVRRAAATQRVSVRDAGLLRPEWLRRHGCAACDDRSDVRAGRPRPHDARRRPGSPGHDG